LHPDLRSRAALVSLISTLVLAVGGCGYRVAGRGTTLPPGAHTIAVPALVNHTTTYRIEQRFTEALVHEFIARTNYRVVPEADGADLVLQGEVTSLGAGAVLYDPTTGAASTLLVTLQLKIGLRDRSGKTLYQNNALVFREQNHDAAIFAFRSHTPFLEEPVSEILSRIALERVDGHDSKLRISLLIQCLA